MDRRTCRHLGQLAAVGAGIRGNLQRRSALDMEKANTEGTICAIKVKSNFSTHTHSKEGHQFLHNLYLLYVASYFKSFWAFWNEVVEVLLIEWMTSFCSREPMPTRAFRWIYYCHWGYLRTNFLETIAYKDYAIVSLSYQMHPETSFFLLFWAVSCFQETF